MEAMQEPWVCQAVRAVLERLSTGRVASCAELSDAFTVVLYHELTRAQFTLLQHFAPVSGGERQARRLIQRWTSQNGGSVRLGIFERALVTFLQATSLVVHEMDATAVVPKIQISGGCLVGSSDGIAREVATMSPQKIMEYVLDVRHENRFAQQIQVSVLSRPRDHAMRVIAVDALQTENQRTILIDFRVEKCVRGQGGCVLCHCTDCASAHVAAGEFLLTPHPNDVAKGARFDFPGEICHVV